eukprot:TRINITY_DN87216_c0_g1_i1.p1 TRINITY_DN87216_c0_g1~~TRINITY_DN87216_c0_g1_i1.p1  ORF type:complete len:468 (-),score=91.71 TRINITY_DN87216_c0_g1_i1:39-1442(-)
MRRSIKVAILLVIAAAVSKRKYPKAALISLLKRLIGYLASRAIATPTPRLVAKAGATSQLGSLLKDLQCKKPLIVSDEVLVKHGLVKKCTDSLQEHGYGSEIFDKIEPNPTTHMIEQGLEVYKAGNCDSIIAVGGGSPMDVAKIIGAKVCNPRPRIEDYQGFFQVNMAGLGKDLPPLVAIPTTAGTGSEATVAAVITVKEENKKIAIADTGLVPRVAILDPELLTKLPKHITAATGMDALTHAIESYVSGWASSYTVECSLAATSLIFKNIFASYSDGANLDAREQMLKASFQAGSAFTRANVGYVHAIAHQFGGMFHTPHGVANAMLLPHVLEFYLADEQDSGNSHCTKLFCNLAVSAGLAEESSATGEFKHMRACADKFVDAVRDLNAKMDIPLVLKEMKASDVKEVAVRALQEAHGEQHSLFAKPMMYTLDLGYPVPKYMTQDECETLLAKLLTQEERQGWKSA